MATTTNYGWETPDDTDLVKDGASAIRTLGSSIDTTTKALNPETTLGDIAYRSATANTNTRLGIGTTGQVLSVSGGVPAWVTPAGASKTWTLLNTGGTALTGAQTITVSGISDVEDLMIFFVQASSASGSSEIGIRFNGDTGTNYGHTGFDIDASSTYSASNFGIQQNLANNQFYLTKLSGNAGSQMSGGVWVSGCKSTGIKAIIGDAGATAAGGTGNLIRSAIGFYAASAAITSVSAHSLSGNFDNGTLYVYGA